MFFKTLKGEMLIFTIGLTAITIVVTVIMGIFSTQNAGENATRSTSAILRKQTEEFLLQIVTVSAGQQDAFFEYVKNSAEIIASHMKNIYENRDIFSNSYWKFNSRIIKENERYLNSASDISTVHIPIFVPLDAQKKKDIELTANLDFVVPTILQSNKNITAIYAIEKDGITRYFPNIILGNLAPPDYNPTEDVYYKPATPKENPNKEIIWSALYDDAAGRGRMITVTAPVYAKNVFHGVVGIDILLAEIINQITSYNPIEGSYAFLIDKDGNAIAFPDKAYIDFLNRQRDKKETQIQLINNSNLSSEFSSLLDEMRGGASGFRVITGKEGGGLFIAYAPLKQTGFSMAIVVEEAIALKAARALHADVSDSIQYTITNFILPVSIIIIIVVSIISMFFVFHITRPIQQLIMGAQEIGSGNLNYNLDVKSRNEIGSLASSFNQMAVSLRKSRQELYEYSQGLEKNVLERTRELTVANQQLKKLDEQKSDFITIASHQLRTPLSIIKGYLSLIFEDSFGKTPKELMEPLNRINISNNRLINLVNELLDLSRIERGKMTYVFQPSSLIPIAEEVFAEIQESAKVSKLKFAYIKPESELPLCNIDPKKIKEVMINFVENAIRYTSQSGFVRMSLSYTKAKNAVKFTVSDSGVGLTKEEISRLFVKFSRMEQAKKISSEGTGLGLYVAKLIIEDHNGRIWAESEGSGKGAAFSFEVPVV